MQSNQTCVPDEALQVNEPMEKIYLNQVLPQDCLSYANCPASWNTLLQRESVKNFQQETEQTKEKMSSKGHRSSGLPLNNRREKIEKESAKGRRV